MDMVENWAQSWDPETSWIPRDLSFFGIPGTPGTLGTSEAP